MMAMMAGTLVTGSFLSNAYYPLMYMMLGIAAASLLGSPFGPQAATVESIRGKLAGLVAAQPRQPLRGRVPAHPPTEAATRLRSRR